MKIPINRYRFCFSHSRNLFSNNNIMKPTTKKLIFFSLAILAMASVKDSITKLYVKFGEAKVKLAASAPPNVVRLYFDRYGFMYPDYPLDDHEIGINDSRLELLFKNNPDLYKTICNKEGIGGEVCNNNHDTDKDPLQRKIIQNAIDSINSKGKEKKIVFLIHGFNKHPLLPIGKSSSDENQKMRQKLKEVYPAVNFLFVEIYWDGCTQVNGQHSAALNSLKIWDNGQAASNYIGLELRRVLCGVNAKNIYVITHSLGASVITTALFNVEKFSDSRYMREIIGFYNDSNIYRTPQQTQLNIGMLAPAIPGTNTFDEYDDRTPNSVKNNNYCFTVGFNKNDEVLQKFLKIPSQMGSTTLGCNAEELLATKQQVNTKNRNVLNSVDFSTYRNGNLQTDHSFITYIMHDRAIMNFMDSVFSVK